MADLGRLSLTEWILRNANDVVAAFFDGVAVDFKSHIGQWLFENIPDFSSLTTVIEIIRDFKPYALMSKDEILRTVGDAKKAERIIRMLNWAGEQLGFFDHNDPEVMKWRIYHNQPDGPDITVFWNKVLPVLANNENRISNEEWKEFYNLAYRARGGLGDDYNIPEKSIYNTIKDHIVLNKTIYGVAAGAAVATVAAAVSYYLYKLYRSGVKPQQVKSRVIADSKIVKHSGAAAAATSSSSPKSSKRPLLHHKAKEATSPSKLGLIINRNAVPSSKRISIAKPKATAIKQKESASSSNAAKKKKVAANRRLQYAKRTGRGNLRANAAANNL